MKKILFSLLFLNLCLISSAQEPRGLPRGFAAGEEEKMDIYLKNRADQVYDKSNKNPVLLTPPTLPARTAAQWEEVQALVLAWTDYLLPYRDKL